MERDRRGVEIRRGGAADKRRIEHVERAFSLDKQNNLMSSWSWSARLIKPDRVDGNAGPERGASGPVSASR